MKRELLSATAGLALLVSGAYAQEKAGTSAADIIPPSAAAGGTGAEQVGSGESTPAAETSGGAAAQGGADAGAGQAQVEMTPQTDEAQAVGTSAADVVPPGAEAGGTGAEQTGSANTENGGEDAPGTKAAQGQGEGNEAASQQPTAENPAPEADQDADAAKPKNADAADTKSAEVTTEQKTEIRKTIVERDVKKVDLDIEINIGVAVPDTVTFYDLPPRIVEIVPAYRAYKYFILADGTIVIVDPQSYEVVYIIAA